MASGQDMINELEFEREIEHWSPAEQFIARQVYAINKRCLVCTQQINDHESRLKAVESGTPAGGSRKQTVVAASFGGGTVGIILAALYTAAQALGWIK